MLPTSIRHITALRNSTLSIPVINITRSSTVPSYKTIPHNFSFSLHNNDNKKKQQYHHRSGSTCNTTHTVNMSSSSGQGQQQQKLQKPKMNVHNFPRPPALEPITRHIQIKWDGQLIAETNEAYWVLETTHPPTYYLPLSALKVELQRSSKSSFCEWKGNATYWNVPKPNAPGTFEKNRVWSYEKPTKGFKDITGYVSFYASPWDCYVDDEKVEAQPGDFYGGWMTNEIEGKVKGGPGTWGW